VYIDASGSVNDYLPEIIGLLRGLRADLKTVFLFSNQVIEVPFKSLLKGYVQTTCGTDFDKAVVVTDGHANMTAGYQNKLARRRFRTLTILIPDKPDCPDFTPFGVIKLEDAIR